MAGLILLAAAARCAVPLPVDFFYEPGCHDCERIEAEVLPAIEEHFADACVIRRFDIGIETNFIRLLELEHAVGHAGPDRAYLVVNRQVAFGPRPDLNRLLAAISERLGQGADAAAPAGAAGNVAQKRYDGFTLGAVLAAGLLDGINPCAISTLVFFMSLLAVSGVRSRQLLLLGVCFCVASFFTYLALGFGLLRALHLFSGFGLLRSVLERVMAAALLGLAFLSFRDAWRFGRSRDLHDIRLQLSTGMKKRIHGVMRRGLKSGHLMAGGLFIGAAVTALESVCTGQVYVPTLVLILRDRAFSQSRAWVYLLAYNLMFLVPLVLVFAAVYGGLRTETLLRWSAKNAVLSKILLGLFFVLMALFLVLI